jgi:hypothetical protein
MGPNPFASIHLFNSSHTCHCSVAQMASTSRISELASIIQRQTAVVDEYLKANGLPTPSFDASYQPALQFTEDISAARDAVLEAMDELQALMLGPMGSIFHEITQKVRYRDRRVGNVKQSTEFDAQSIPT